MRQRTKISGVKHIIAVSSAKGGVGKSTLSVNLALALKNLGKTTCLMDADISGPSMPTMMSVKREQVEVYGSAGNERFIPAANYGVKVMSMGLIVPPDEAVALRGPMVNKYLRALLFQTDWGDNTDILLLDMPRHPRYPSHHRPRDRDDRGGHCDYAPTDCLDRREARTGDV